MGFSCGIVGLPNVGKSTLFNAITRSNVEAANYPFCTIEPNKGIVAVPDKRVDFLARVNQSKKIIYTTVEFTDIAGLVAGASKGEGLGNKFLGHIRETDTICQVVRLFSDENVSHAGEMDPLKDLETIHLELLLADLETVEKRLQATKKKTRSGDKQATAELERLEKIKSALERGIMLNTSEWSLEEKRLIQRELNLMSIKPMVIIGNLDEERVSDYKALPDFQKLKRYAEKNDYPLIALCAKLEREMSELDGDSLAECLDMYGLDHLGLEELITQGYRSLDLITFFTSGEKETRAWTVKKGTLASQAAGTIHTDFEKGFIKAETIGYEDFATHGSFHACKDSGKLRMEGREYVVCDGDIFVFRFNV